MGPHHAASKAGILGLTHYCASLLAKEGITVNAVAPALMLAKNGYVTGQTINVNGGSYMS